VKIQYVLNGRTDVQLQFRADEFISCKVGFTLLELNCANSLNIAFFSFCDVFFPLYDSVLHTLIPLGIYLIKSNFEPFRNYLTFEGESTMDFLRDPIWQFIGVIVGFITIIVTIVLSQRQQNRKEISYQVISDAFIISIDKEVKDRVKILFDDRPVKDMSLLILRLWKCCS
jgi:hypothetical protein